MKVRGWSRSFSFDERRKSSATDGLGVKKGYLYTSACQEVNYLHRDLCFWPLRASMIV